MADRFASRRHTSFPERFRRQSWLRRLHLPAVAAVLVGLVTALALGLGSAASISPPSAVTEFHPDIKWGGRTVAVTVSPANSQDAIAAAESGGLFKTTDGGATWSHIDSFPWHRMWDVQYDPSNASLIIATTFSDIQTTNGAGILRSTNGGVTWSKPATADSPSAGCTAVRNARGISFGAGGFVFVGTECGIAVSSDSGATWSHADPDPGNASRRIFDVVAQSGGIVDICGDDGHHRSINNGGGWTPVNAGAGALPGGRCSIDASPFETGVLFATTGGGILWESDDGGTSWTNLGAPGANNRPPFVETHPAVDGDGSHFDVYFGNGVLMYRQHCVNSGGPGLRCPVQAETGAQCSNSTDDDGDQIINEGCPANGTGETQGGKASDPQCNDSGDDDGDGFVNDGCPVMIPYGTEIHDWFDHIDIAFDTSSPTGCPMLIASDGGVGTTSDCGATWANSNTGLQLQMYEITGTTHPGGDSDLYFGTQDNDVWASADSGVTWPGRARFEGFFIETPQTRPATGQVVTATTCGACSNRLLASDFSTNDLWDNPIGGGGNPFLIKEGSWAQVSAPTPRLGNGAESGSQCDSADTDGDNLADDGCTFLFVSVPEAGADCSNSTDDDADGAVNDGCPANGAAESGAQCHDAADSDGDTKVNDGCSSISSVESGSQCGTDTNDDDGDGAVNDGCAKAGAVNESSGCGNAFDGDFDGSVNDGCPQVGATAESGGQCANATDDDAADADGIVNDGCPQVGATAESGAEPWVCYNATNDDPNDDTSINDGCPKAGVWAQSGPALPRLAESKLVVTGPASSPTIYVVTVKAGNTRGLSKITGISGGSATVSTADTGLSNLSQYCNGQGTFRCPYGFGVDPNNPLHLIAADVGTSQVKVSTDGGASWTPDAELTALVTDNGNFLFREPNFGAQLHVIAFDPNDGNRVFVGTEAAGVFASVDGGDNWINISGSDEIQVVSGFFFDEVQDTILVSSYGRGLWTLTLPETDLSVTKTDSPDPVTAGEQLFYTITATNNGPEVATVEVVDTLPPEVTFVDDNLPPPLDCTEGPPGEVRCDVGVLGVSDSITFDIKVHVNTDAVVASGPKAIFNTVNVRSTDSIDPDTDDNSVTEGTFVEDLADLQVTKLCKPDDPALAGAEPGECTIFIDNFGPSDARNVVLTDTNVSNGSFTIFAVTPSQGSCDPPAAGVVTCDLGDIPAGTGVTVLVEVSATSAVDVNDLATVVSDTPDPDPTNNQATGSISFFEEADLRVTKLCKPDDELLAGETGTCTIFVDNLGPSDASSVHLTDTSVSNGSFSFGTITTSQGSCDPPAGGVVTCDLGGIGAASPTEPGRATVAIEITATEAMDINDIATVVSSTPDPDFSNNEDQDGVSVTAVSNLSLTKSAIPEPVLAGENLTYTLVATNNGPSTAANVLVDDALPLRVSIVSVSGTGGASCVAGQPGNPLLRTSCAFDSLAPGGGSETMTVVVTVDSGVLGFIQNDARVVSDVFDPDNSNDFASENTTVNAEADLSISKVDLSDPVVAGTLMTYELTVVNNGPSDAVGVVVEDALPDEVVFQSATISNGSGTCVLLDVPPNTVSCQLDTVAPNVGSPIFIYIDVLVKSDTPHGAVMTNDSSVTSSTTDPAGGNNTSAQNTDVNAVADLRITKTSGQEIYSPKQTIVYTIEVTNLGPSDAQAVEVIDVLPLSPVTKKVIYQFDNGGCAHDASTNVLTCPLGILAAGASTSFEVHIDVKGSLGLITNVVTVSTTTFDPDLANDATSKDVLIEGSAGNKGKGPKK